jgi:hypothetical protein
MFKTIKGNSFLIFSIAALFLFVGCSDDDEKIMGVDMGQGAMVRVIHASPDAPNVDLYVEGIAAAVATDIAYGETTVYLDLDAGMYNFQLRAAGSNPASPPAYETGDLDIAEGAKITAIALGLLASADADDKFRVITYAENFADPGAGNAAVRIIHGSADAPTVAVDVGNDGAPEVPNFARFAETGAAGVALPAGTEIQIAIWAGAPLERVTVFTTPQLPSGAELFVIATGLLGKLPREADGFSLLAAGPAGTIGFIKQNPVVFALHGSPDAPAVDIYAGSSELVDNLAFGELSAPIQVPPGSYDLDFRANDDGPIAASATTPALAAGERYLAIASGFLNDTPAFILLPYADAFALGGSDARVRAIHASPDAPAVDIGTVAANVLTPVPDYTNVSFQDASVASGTSLPVAQLLIGVAPMGDTNPLVTFDITTAAGLRAYAVAAGSLQGTGESFRLVIVDTSTYPWVAAEVLPN